LKSKEHTEIVSPQPVYCCLRGAHSFADGSACLIADNFQNKIVNNSQNYIEQTNNKERASRQTHTQGNNKSNEGKHAECDHVEKRQRTQKKKKQ
jgi:hypothetical protein